MIRPTPKEPSLTVLRLARAAAGTPTDKVAAVCGLSDRDLRKHLRSVPARSRCAAMVAAVAVTEKAPDPPGSAAAGNRVCPPPAVRAARLVDLKAVAAARGSASWALAHLPFRGGSMALYAFGRSGGLHRGVMAGLAVASDQYYRTGLAENPSCPPAILDRFADDPNQHVRAAAAHTRRRCGCDERSGLQCEAAASLKESLEACEKYLDSIRAEDAATTSLRDLR